MTVIVDKNVITDIARGNKAVADALKHLLNSWESVYIARAAYNELVRDSPGALGRGYEQLLNELNLTVAPISEAVTKVQWVDDKGGKHEVDIPTRLVFIADNFDYQQVGRGQPGKIREYGKGAANETPGDAYVAAEAKSLNARLWTLDENFAKRAANQGVEIARESQIKGISGVEDIARARRLMDRPLSPPVKTAPTGASGGVPPKPRSGGDEKTNETVSETGAPIEPVQESGPNMGADAKFQGAIVGLQAVDALVQKLNNKIQAGRFNAEWSRQRGEVQRRLDADPQLGALVLVSYSKGEENPDSSLGPVTVFEGIQVGYGLDPDDALRDAASQSRMGSGRSDVGDKIWLKPKAPMDIKRLKLPFGATIAGLATFVPGKEKLVRVKFSRYGFDDKMISKEELSVPANMTPRFYFLWPPASVRFFQNGWETTDVDWELSNDADMSYGDVDPFMLGVPVVKLDSWINPYNATAAMVWPADNSTANLFARAHATEDINNLLSGQGIGPLRWVRPEFIRVLKFPVDTNP